MFPTLFPFGTGGFDDDSHPVSIGFQTQAEYFFDLVDRSFHSHRCFIFHVLNVHQHRMTHLWSGLTVQKGHYNSIAPILASLDPETVRSIAHHIENEGKISDLNAEQKKVVTLMQEVNTIGAKIPGSSSAKLCSQNEIRAFFGYFALPQLYLTLNPMATHSLIFQVMYGDNAVNLAQRFPTMVASHQ
jgi:hypothetical protein